MQIRHPKNLKSNLNDRDIETFPSYKFTNSLNLLLICMALSEQNRYLEAIQLFEKFRNEIKKSENLISGLTTIILICKENCDLNLANFYSQELELIEI